MEITANMPIDVTVCVDELLLLSQQLSTIERPSPRNLKSLATFVDNEKPLVSRESRFINHGEDFITLVNMPEGGWLDERIESTLSRWPCWLTKVCLGPCLTLDHNTQIADMAPPPVRLLQFMFMSPDQRNKTDNPYIHYYDKDRISTLVRLIITVGAAVILIVPVFVLFGLTNATPGMIKVLIVFLFTLVFAAALAVSTQAKRQEIFAATAA
jgi:hypothetical protein